MAQLLIMMKSKLQTAIILLVIALSLNSANAIYAQSAPRWVTKGVKAINAQRSNNTYEVASFNTQDHQLEMLKSKELDVLKDYVAERYNVNPHAITVVPASDEGPQPEYEVTYVGPDNVEYRIQAKCIDTYTNFDDYELNVYQFEHHQLYAISRPNVKPVFDTFEYVNSNQGVSAAMALVPGLAQYYKGQTSKANVIVGAELVFAGATVLLDYKRRDCHKMVSKDSFFADSWKSKERGWRNFEIGTLAGFIGVYIYNVIDGIKSQGPRQIRLKKADRPTYTLAPYANTDEAGLCFTVNF